MPLVRPLRADARKMPRSPFSAPLISERKEDTAVVDIEKLSLQGHDRLICGPAQAPRSSPYPGLHSGDCHLCHSGRRASCRTKRSGTWEASAPRPLRKSASAWPECKAWPGACAAARATAGRSCTSSASAALDLASVHGQRERVGSEREGHLPKVGFAGFSPGIPVDLRRLGE